MDVVKTGGYDMLIEINERLVNHAMAAAFYSSYYTAFEGTVVPKISPPFENIAKVDYRLELAEPPFVNFIRPDQVMVRLGLTAVVKVVGRKVRVDFSVDLLGRMALDPVAKEVSMEVLSVKLGELRLLDRYELPKVAKSLVNDALVLAVRSSFVRGATREVKIPVTSAPAQVHLGDEIRISLLPGFPGMIVKVPPAELEVSSLVPARSLDMGEVDVPVSPAFFGVISDHSIALAITMQENFVGDPAGVKDFTEGNDLAIGLSEASLNRVLDQVWSQIPRDVRVSGTIPVENVRELLESLQGIRDMPSRFETLGLTRKDTELEKAWVDFSAIIDPQRPNFRMGEGGLFEVYDTRAQARAVAVVRAVEVTTVYKGRNAFFAGWTRPREQTPPEVRRQEVELYTFDSDIGVLLRRVVVNLVVDEDGGLKFDVADIDFSLDIPWRLPKFVLERISNRIEQSIRENFPAVDVTKMIQERMAPMLPFTPQLKIAKVSTEGSEALITGNLVFKEVPTRVSPVPSFVADPRNGSREVHRASCPSVRKIPEGVQVGYTSLYDALADGHRGASDCLPEFRQGLTERGHAVSIPEVDIPLVPAKEVTVVREAVLKPIPLSGADEQKTAKVVVTSCEEPADRAGHEVEGEEHQHRPAPEK